MSYSGLSAFDAAPGMVAVLGIPSDVRSSFLKGAAEGPAKVRQVMVAGGGNLCTEDGLDLGGDSLFGDAGDFEIQVIAGMDAGIEESVKSLLDREVKVVSIGGDHAITLPVIRAYSKAHEGINLLHLDAHPDLYDEHDGSRESHCCTFARIMEEGLVRRLVQVGIRASTPHQQEQAKRFGVEVVTADDLASSGLPELSGPLYVSIDMDVLDPAFAPGVSHPEPGGMSTREVIRLIKGLKVPVVGADIVELNPSRDCSDITAVAAFKLLKEVAAVMLR